MTVNRLIDNIMQVYKVQLSGNGVTTVSEEIDLELPRGYVAKVHLLDFWQENYEAAAAASENQRMNCALVRDPDDAVTTEIPEHSVAHDVIAEFQSTYMMDAADDFSIYNGLDKQLRFDQAEEMDIISFRNMRFNCVEENASGQHLKPNLAIYYTLEKVKDEEILALLDIL